MDGMLHWTLMANRNGLQNRTWTRSTRLTKGPRVWQYTSSCKISKEHHRYKSLIQANSSNKEELRGNPIQNGNAPTPPKTQFSERCGDLLVYNPKLEKCGNLQNHNLWTEQTFISNCWTYISGRYPFAHWNYWHMSKHRNLNSTNCYLLMSAS